MRRIAIFASGSGSNAQNIADFFKNNQKVKIDCILSNRSDAYVLKRAEELEIETFIFSREDFYQRETVLHFLQERDVDFVVLAGFLWLIPSYLIKSFPGSIINIHPALLPKYGGKGMYGMHVHKAVVDAGERETGITIHYVNERYDEGSVIFQATCPVLKTDSPEVVAGKVHALEYEHFPRVIDRLLSSNDPVK